jgi:hypothetical protein
MKWPKFRVFSLIVLLFALGGCQELTKVKVKKMGGLGNEANQIIDHDDNQDDSGDDMIGSTEDFGIFLETHCVRGDIDNCYKQPISTVKSIINL